MVLSTFSVAAEIQRNGAGKVVSTIQDFFKYFVSLWNVIADNSSSG